MHIYYEYYGYEFEFEYEFEYKFELECKCIIICIEYCVFNWIANTTMKIGCLCSHPILI